MSQLHNDCNMPDLGTVKSEFAWLNVAIVPNGTPSRGARYDHLFALWTQIFAAPGEENRIRLYAFLTD